MEQILTFDKLPEAVTMLTKEVSELKRLLIEKQEQPPTDQPEQLLTIQAAAEFFEPFSTHNVQQGIKRRIARNEAKQTPVFSHTELLQYLKEGRKKSNAEIEQEAGAYLLNTKKGLNNGK